MLLFLSLLFCSHTQLLPLSIATYGPPPAVLLTDGVLRCMRCGRAVTFIALVCSRSSPTVGSSMLLVARVLFVIHRLVRSHVFPSVVPRQAGLVAVVETIFAASDARIYPSYLIVVTSVVGGATVHHLQKHGFVSCVALLR